MLWGFGKMTLFRILRFEQVQGEEIIPSGQFNLCQVYRLMHYPYSITFLNIPYSILKALPVISLMGLLGHDCLFAAPCQIHTRW